MWTIWDLGLDGHSGQKLRKTNIFSQCVGKIM